MDTSLETLTDNLRQLVTDPDRRARLGRESREFALRRHSYAALGRIWELIVTAAWRDEPVPPALSQGDTG